MRKNIFLHFMNRDTREIARLYDVLGRANHARVIREPLNAAVMLCEEFCIAAAGFVVEDELAFELFEAQAAFLKAGIIQLPIRERNLADFAEKKRSEYSPARSRYSGLFDDSRMMYLSSLGSAIVSRKVQIGTAIVSGFQNGVDTKSEAWRLIRSHASPTIIDNMRKTPDRLAEEGKALTWSIMKPNFSEEATPFMPAMRDALQHVYFKEYCTEFMLVLLSDIPYVPETFYLPTDRKVYSLKRLRTFLNALGVADIFLSASGDFLVEMRRHAGFTELIDAYVGMAIAFPDASSLSYHTARAVRAATFKWHALGARGSGTISDPTAVEMVEIADGCRELAGILSREHNLAIRLKSTPKSDNHARANVVRGRRMKVSVFVALEEELDVLVRHLHLTRRAGMPAAVGKIGAVEVDVLCPREMGRVAAAVEVTKYLSQADLKPEIILCVGLAGGFEEAKIDPGTVICVDTVVDLANRKVTDDTSGKAQSRFRRQDFSCLREVYSVARSHEFDLDGWEAHCRREFDWPQGRTPSLREGKIASVDEVISSDDHRRKLVDGADKLLGVEMEAGGVCAAAARFKLPVSVLRVVSDMADPSKADDAWRKLGMRTLAELIKRMPIKKIIENAKN